MATNYPRAVKDRNEPYIGVVAITGSDQTFTVPVRGVIVMTGTTLACTFTDGSTATLTGLTPGKIYKFAITGITDTGTDVTGYVLV